MKLKKTPSNKLKNLNHKVISFNVSLPVWLLIFIALLPLIAYADRVMSTWSNMGYTLGFGYYMAVTALELFFIWMGYLLGVNRKS